MSTSRKFIIVDDDYLNNLLCTIVIEDELGNADITSFENPRKALAFIQDEYINSVVPTILLLDINMPTLSGWEFLDEFEEFSEAIKKQFCIYMVTSSVDHRDKDRASANNYVKGFISKPLEADAILSMAHP